VSAPFRVRALASHIRPVIQDGELEEPAMMPRFPAAFRPPAFASRSSHPRRGVGPPSRSAYRTNSPDPDGVTTFRTHEQRPGRASLIPRGRWCSPRPGTVPGRAPAAISAASPYTPLLHPIHGAGVDEASTEIHAIHPSGLPLACGPRMERAPSGFPPSSEPHHYWRRTSGQGQAMSTSLELCARHQPSLQSTKSPRNVRPRIAPLPRPRLLTQRGGTICWMPPAYA
jgi:hypothetical protein